MLMSRILIILVWFSTSCPLISSSQYIYSTTLRNPQLLFSFQSSVHSDEEIFRLFWISHPLSSPFSLGCVAYLLMVFPHHSGPVELISGSFQPSDFALMGCWILPSTHHWLVAPQWTHVGGLSKPQWSSNPSIFKDYFQLSLRSNLHPPPPPSAEAYPPNTYLSKLKLRRALSLPSHLYHQHLKVVSSEALLCIPLSDALVHFQLPLTYPLLLLFGFFPNQYRPCLPSFAP